MHLLSNARNSLSQARTQAEPIGYVILSAYGSVPVCKACRDRVAPYTFTPPLYRSSVFPFSQTCEACGKTLVLGLPWYGELYVTTK